MRKQTKHKQTQKVQISMCAYANILHQCKKNTLFGVCAYSFKMRKRGDVPVPKKRAKKKQIKQQLTKKNAPTQT